MLNKKLLTGLALSIFMIFTVCSCNTQEQTVTPIVDPELKVPITGLSRLGGEQFIQVKADGAWSLSLDFGEDVLPWASLDAESGSGSTSGIVLSWEENTNESSRSCRLTLVNGKNERNVVLNQPGIGGGSSSGGQTTPSDIVADIPGKWLELPATDDPELYFITHATTIKGKPVRNYSIYYDIEAKLSPWVAYPLNKNLMGDVVERVNVWGALDPKIPAKYQQKLDGAYRRGSDGSSYQRGHQIPSADRLASRADNTSTFYAPNMTPQKGVLNGEAWASLEGRVRGWAKQMDTLYVVTGADYKNSKTVAYDNNGDEIPVPTGYFKALLGYKKSLAFGQSTGGYIGIAFYFEHKGYDDYMSRSMSIAELERKLKYDFFVNLPEVITANQAVAVENKIDSWWNNN